MLLGMLWCCPCLLSLKSTICAIILVYSLAFIRFPSIFEFFSPVPEMDYRTYRKRRYCLRKKGIVLNLHHLFYKKKVY